MPTSHYAQISKVVEIIYLLKPASLLDVGVGYGKYGALAREFLEMWIEYKPYGQRKVRIDGIEGFPEYIHDGHRFYYDNIFVGNALDQIRTVGTYDLIILIDVLEHFDHQGGLEIVKQCVAKSKNVLISTPLDMGEQGAVFGNELERHRFQWEKNHFREFGPVTFFWNYHSLLCLLGPDGGRIKKRMSGTGWKIWVRSMFPQLYILYRKYIRKLFT